MTRKRFIKLLMSKGLSRNTANKTATYCREHNIEYSSYFWGVATNCLVNAVEKIKNCINNCAEAFIGFVEKQKTLYEKIAGGDTDEDLHSRQDNG